MLHGTETCTDPWMAWIDGKWLGNDSRPHEAFGYGRFMGVHIPCIDIGASGFGEEHPNRSSFLKGFQPLLLGDSQKNKREKPTSWWWQELAMQCNIQTMVTLPKLNSEFTPEKFYGTKK